MTGVGFGDTLPTGLAVANPNGLTGSCGTGAITTGSVSGASVVNLSNGAIPAAGSCTFSVNVVGVAGGHQVNTTGTVTSANAGSGNQATASIDVIAPDPTIAAAHTGNFAPGQTGATFTLTVSNNGFGPTSGTVTVTDTLPNVPNTFVPTAMSGTGWTCTLATLTCTRADALASGSSYPAITLTVNVPQNISPNVTNTATVSGGGDVNTNNNTATDATHVGAPLQISSGNNSLTVTQGSSGTVTFTVNSSPGLGTVTFACSGLPAGAACSFNPASENQLSATVTMTVSTAAASAAVMPLDNVSPTLTPTPIYAMVFPVIGLIGFGARNKKVRRKLFMLAAGAMVLLSLASCGDHKTTIAAGTPKGAFALTVTASGTGTQATTIVNVTVQ